MDGKLIVASINNAFDCQQSSPAHTEGRDQSARQWIHSSAEVNGDGDGWNERGHYSNYGLYNFNGFLLDIVPFRRTLNKSFHCEIDTIFRVMLSLEENGYWSSATDFNFQLVVNKRICYSSTNREMHFYRNYQESVEMKFLLFFIHFFYFLLFVAHCSTLAFIFSEASFSSQKPVRTNTSVLMFVRNTNRPYWLFSLLSYFR